MLSLAIFQEYAFFVLFYFFLSQTTNASISDKCQHEKNYDIFIIIFKVFLKLEYAYKHSCSTWPLKNSAKSIPQSPAVLTCVVLDAKLDYNDDYYTLPTLSNVIQNRQSL